jgi:hypothetical protein
MSMIPNNPVSDKLVALETKIAEQDSKLDELLTLLRLLIENAPRRARRPIGFVVNA